MAAAAATAVAQAEVAAAATRTVKSSSERNVIKMLCVCLCLTALHISTAEYMYNATCLHTFIYTQISFETNSTRILWVCSFLVLL